DLHQCRRPGRGHLGYPPPLTPCRRDEIPSGLGPLTEKEPAMSFKTTYILFGILGAVVVVFVLALFFAPVTPPNTKYVFPSAHDPTTKVTENDVVRVEVHRGDQTLVFTREGGKKKKHFGMEEPASHRINDAQVLSLVREVLNAEKVEDTDLSSDLAQYGLKDPSGRVVLKTEGGRELTMYLGNSNARRVYVTSS